MAPKIAKSVLAPDPTTEEMSAAVGEWIEMYRNVGLRFGDIDYPSFLELFLAFPDVEKLFRYLKGFLQQGIIVPLITQAEIAGIIRPNSIFCAYDVLSFYEWLRTGEGAIAVRKVQVEKKLLKSAPKTRTARDVAYVKILEQMRLDYAVDLKESRASDEQAETENKFKVKYPIVANFPTINAREMREISWSKFLDLCNADGVTPLPRTSANLDTITDEFRPDVTTDMIYNYCDDPNVRAQLLKYAKQRIKHLVKSIKLKEAQRFRDIYATASGKAFVASGIRMEELADDLEDSDGEDLQGSTNVVIGSKRKEIIRDEGESSTAKGSGDGRCVAQKSGSKKPNTNGKK